MSFSPEGTLIHLHPAQSQASVICSHSSGLISFFTEANNLISFRIQTPENQRFFSWLLKGGEPSHALIKSTTDYHFLAVPIILLGPCYKLSVKLHNSLIHSAYLLRLNSTRNCSRCWGCNRTHTNQKETILIILVLMY